MATVIVTLKVRLEAPDTDIDAVQARITEKVEAFEGKVGKFSIEDVAFGIKAIIVVFGYDEKKGSSDDLEEDIGNVEGVSSVDVVNVSRAMG